MSDLKELNKEQSELVQKHSEYLKSEVGYALALEECTDILMDFHNEMKQANVADEKNKQALPVQNVSGWHLNTPFTFRCQDEETNLKAIDVEFVINEETGQDFPEMKIHKLYK